MHIKYKQDNLHRMTWYTSMCSSNGHGLTIYVSFMIKCVYYTGLWIHWFHDHDATILNGTVTIRRTSLVGVSHSGSDPIMPLMLRMVCFVQWLEHWHCTTGPSRHHQPYWERVISRVDHIVELWLLFTSYAYIIIIHISRINKLSWWNCFYF